MNFDDVYQTAQSVPHTGSGKGMSYWKTANDCGRLVQLKTKHPYPEQEAGDELNGLRVGTFYHALHEASLKGQATNEVWDMTDSAITDIDWMEALRLYRAYTKDWGTPAQKWHADILSVEVVMPSKPETKVIVHQLFGEDVTFKPDWVGYIREPELFQDATNLVLRSGGRYLFDHKTSNARKPIHQWEYAFGNQAIAYMYLYNLEHPNEPAIGMIHDQIIKHVEISKEPLRTKTGTIKRESSYEHFVTYPNPDAEKVIQSLVQRGMEQLEGEGRANPAHCFSGYKPCHFFQNGLCGRF